MCIKPTHMPSTQVIATHNPIFSITGVVWGIYLFGEEHSNWVWLSMIVMLVGMALVSPKNKS